MDEKLFDAFEYAIEAGNIEMFDLLAKDFDKFEQKDKNALLERTVVAGPDTEFIQHVLDYGYDLNYKDDDGNTLLHFAAVSSHPETVRFFISKGLDKEAKNKIDATPLCVAAKENENVEVLKALIDGGCNIKATSHGGETLLITAAGVNPNPEITKFLLKQGFDTEDRDDEGFTALLNAAFWQDNVDVLSLLVDSGANIHAKSKKGDNLFHHAAFNRNVGVARFISSAFKTSDVNNEGETSMEKVLAYGSSPDVLKLFLRKQKEEQVMTAACNSNPEIIETLIQCGYDPNTSDADGVTAMMMAAHCNENPDVISMLRYYRAIWNSVDEDGRTVLHHAAANPEPAIYNWMLEDDDFKALKDKEDSKGHKPEYYREHADEF